MPVVAAVAGLLATAVAQVGLVVAAQEAVKVATRQREQTAWVAAVGVEAVTLLAETARTAAPAWSSSGTGYDVCSAG